MTEHQIDLPAGTIHYRVAGPEDGAPVVFVHGFLVDATVWSDVPERLAAQGYRVYAPTWPLGSHRTAMRDGADLSPRGVARVVLSFLEALDLSDVVLVGNDSGGAVSQLLVDEDPTRIARLVLTNCDAFEVFPPFPFGPVVQLCGRPRLGRALLAGTRLRALRHSPVAFGMLARRLDPAVSRAWVEPYLTDAGVRRDVATLARGWSRDDLVGASTRLASFERPVLLVWAPEDRLFRIALAHRLRDAAADARLVEVPDARTFVAIDQPQRVADEIAAFALV